MTIVRVHDGGDGAGEHGQAIDGLPPVDGKVLERLAADLQHLKAARGGTKFPHDVVEDISGHDALAGLAAQVYAHGGRHLHLDALVDERLEQMPANAYGERAEGAHLRYVAIKVHHKGARRRIPQLGRNVVADA